MNAQKTQPLQFKITNRYNHVQKQYCGSLFIIGKEHKIQTKLLRTYIDVLVPEQQPQHINSMLSISPPF